MIFENGFWMKWGKISTFCLKRCLMMLELVLLGLYMICMLKCDSFKSLWHEIRGFYVISMWTREQSMKIWVCSLSHQSVASSEDSCVLREPRISCGRPATSSDLQRPDVARLRSERWLVCLCSSVPSLVVAQRPWPDFEKFLHVVWWLWVYNMFRFGLIICYMYGLIEPWVGMMITCLYEYVDWDWAMIS